MADSRIDELRRRLERDPGSRLFAQLAEEHRKAGEHAEAIRVARAGLVQHPSYPSARLTLGRALLDSGDPGGARVELEAALHDAPDNILASRFLGQALEALGELGPAVVQLQRTLKMAPGDRQLESQIVSLETRLRSPQPSRFAQGSAGARVGVEASERTTPLAQMGPPESTGVDKSADVALPPTLRIQTPADRGAWTRSAPPPLPPTAPPSPPPPSVPAPHGAGGRGSPPAAPAEVATAAVMTLPARPLRTRPGEPGIPPALPTAPSPRPGPADEAAAPTLPPRAVAAEETVFEAEVQPGPEEVGRSATAAANGPEGAATGAGTPFSSSTLAELYFRQGLVDRAVAVYRQVLDEEPENAKVRSRLAELESPRRPSDARAARRAALERTIAGLEALLVVLQRR